LPLHARGKPLEIWWQDEARVGQQGTLTRIWAKRGSRPRVLRDRRFTWAYLFGAVCPDRGVGAAIVMPTVNLDAMNKHLAEISFHVAPGSHCVLQVDGAGWHGPSEKLIVPHNITLLKIPPYTPELNPVENIWEYLRGNSLSNVVWETYDEIVQASCSAWNKLVQAPELIKSIASREWAKWMNV
jgi:DDE superfamily endonuclease